LFCARAGVAIDPIASIKITIIRIEFFVTLASVLAIKQIGMI